MRRVLLALLACGRLFAVATPGFVQTSNGSLTWGYNNLNQKSATIALAQPASIGNIVIVDVFLAAASAPTGLVVADNSGGANSFASVNSQGSATNGSFLAQYCSVLAAASQTFKVSATTDLNNGGWVKLTATEYYNSTCTVDQTWARDATAGLTTLTFTGTKTIATSGDLLHFIAAGDNGVIQSSFTAGTGQTGITCPGQAAGSWCLVPGSGQIWDQMPQQWAVYPSTTALNPKMTVSASTQAVILCVALKASAVSAGVPPPTTVPWIYAVQQGAVFNLTQGPPQFGPANISSPVKFQFPTMGNAIMISFTGAAGTYPSAISSGVAGDAYTVAQRIDATPSSAAGYSAIWTACATSPSQSRIISVTVTGGSATDNTYTFYDIGNVNTSSGTGCRDTGGTTSGTQGSVGAAITQTIGPFAASNEIAIGVVSVDQSGVITTAQASGINYTQGNFTMNNGGTPQNQCDSGISPPQPWDECNGFANLVTTSTSSVTATYNHVTDGSAGLAFADWNAVWEALKGPASTIHTMPPAVF